MILTVCFAERTHLKRECKSKTINKVITCKSLQKTPVNHFTFIIQILWKFQLFATWFLEEISKHNFAHGMTALQNFLGIHLIEFRWEDNEISIKFELQERNDSWNMPWNDDLSWWHHQLETFPHYWPLCGEFTSHWWIHHTKTSDMELWWFLWSVPQ